MFAGETKIQALMPALTAIFDKVKIENDKHTSLLLRSIVDDEIRLNNGFISWSCLCPRNTKKWANISLKTPVFVRYEFSTLS
jgi:hypothetical protein